MTTETNEVSTEAPAITPKVVATPEFQLRGQLDNETDADYRRSIREEAKQHRLNAATWETKWKEAEAKLLAAEHEKVATLEQVQTVKEAARDQIAINNIELVAVKEGCLGTDVLEKLLDPKTFDYDESGKIKNADALIKGLKTSHPYLFGSPATASPAKVPATTSSGTKDLSDAEYKARKRAMGIR